MEENKAVSRPLLLLISVVYAFLIAEILLRFAGYKPWRYYTFDRHEPTMHEFDPSLGWKNKEGAYIIPPYSEVGNEIHVTYLNDGSRRTGAAVQTNAPKIMLFGDSFVNGWAISDDETLGWRLQKRFPQCEVKNYGTGDYSTYQSLLLGCL